MKVYSALKELSFLLNRSLYVSLFMVTVMLALL